jgi:hypothetical protein
MSKQNKMTNTMKKYATGMVAAGIIATASIANASNTADLTSLHRQCPSQFYMASADSNNTQWIAGVQPFGSKNQFNALGFALKSPSVNLEEVILSGEAVKGLSIALDAVKLNDYTPSVSIAADYSGKNYGFGAVASQNSLDLGARASYKSLTAFVTSPAQKFSPTYGITADARHFKVEASFNPETGKYDAVVSKVFPSKKGTFLPQIKVDKTSVGIAVGYIPAGGK